MKQTPKNYRSLHVKGLNITSDRNDNLANIRKADLSREGYEAIATATAAAEGHCVRDDHVPIHTAASEALFGASEVQNPGGEMNVGAKAIKAEQLDDYLAESSLSDAAVMSDEDYANLPPAPSPRAKDGTLHADMEALASHFTEIEKRYPHTPVSRAILNNNSIYEAEENDQSVSTTRQKLSTGPRRG